MQYHVINFSESALAPPDKLLASLAESWPGLKAFSAVNERSGLEQLPGNYPLCFQIAYLTSQMQEMSSVYQCVCVWVCDHSDKSDHSDKASFHFRERLSHALNVSLPLALQQWTSQLQRPSRPVGHVLFARICLHCFQMRLFCFSLAASQSSWM